MARYLVILIAVAGGLAATNPREQDHHQELLAHARAACRGGVVEKMLCGGMAEFAASGLEYHDRLLFSTARAGDTETLGLLGNVLVVKG